MSSTGSAPRRDDSLVLDARSLGRVPGAVLTIQRTAALPESIGAEMMRLPAGSDLDLDLILTCVEEGVLVTGAVSGVAEVECARCLGSFTAPVSTDLTELYAYRGSAAAAGAEEDEVRLLNGDLADLEPALIDSFGLDFPLAPTCQEVGRRECVSDQIPAPDGVSGQESGRIDPRWAGLAEKFDSGSADGRA